MPDTTIEAAKRCPRCGNPGRNTKVSHNADRSRMETYTCESKNCPWFNTGWVLQIMGDGTLARRAENASKQFAMSPGMENIGRNLVKETEFIFGLDREPSDPEYGVQRDLKEIRSQF